MEVIGPQTLKNHADRPSVGVVISRVYQNVVKIDDHTNI